MTPDAHLVVFRLADGATHREMAFPGVEGAAITSASRGLAGDSLAAGTADGRVALSLGALPAGVRGADPEGPRHRPAPAGRRRGRPGEAAGPRGRLPGVRRGRDARRRPRRRRRGRARPGGRGARRASRPPSRPSRRCAPATERRSPTSASGGPRSWPAPSWDSSTTGTRRGRAPAHRRHEGERRSPDRGGVRPGRQHRDRRRPGRRTSPAGSGPARAPRPSPRW